MGVRRPQLQDTRAGRTKLAYPVISQPQRELEIIGPGEGDDLVGRAVDGISDLRARSAGSAASVLIRLPARDSCGTFLAWQSVRRLRELDVPMAESGGPQMGHACWAIRTRSLDSDRRHLVP